MGMQINFIHEYKNVCIITGYQMKHTASRNCIENSGADHSLGYERAQRAPQPISFPLQ